MNRADVEGYTGEGEPPYCEMTISNANPKITPPDLHIVATINGIKNSANIEIKKEAQNVVECVCQVFYHKLGLNWWKATLAFLPKEHLTVRLILVFKMIMPSMSYFSDGK